MDEPNEILKFHESVLSNIADLEYMLSVKNLVELMPCLTGRAQAPDAGPNIYLHAVYAEYLAGKEKLDAESLARLVRAAGAYPDRDRISDIVKSKANVNYMPYVGITYFMASTGIGVEQKNFFKLVYGLKIPAEEQMVDSTMKAYKSVLAKDDLYLKELGMVDGRGRNYRVNLKEMRNLSFSFLRANMKELLDLFAKSSVPADVISTCISTVCALYLAGKHIDSENAAALLKEAEMPISKQASDIIGASGIKNKMVYLGAAYYLSMSSLDMTPENLMDVASALDLPPDVEIAKDVLKAFDELS